MTIQLGMSVHIGDVKNPVRHVWKISYDEAVFLKDKNLLGMELTEEENTAFTFTKYIMVLLSSQQKPYTKRMGVVSQIVPFSGEQMAEWLAVCLVTMRMDTETSYTAIGVNKGTNFSYRASDATDNITKKKLMYNMLKFQEGCRDCLENNIRVSIYPQKADIVKW